MLIGNGRNNIDETWNAIKAIFLCNPSPELVEVNLFVGIVRGDELEYDSRTYANEKFGVGGHKCDRDGVIPVATLARCSASSLVLNPRELAFKHDILVFRAHSQMTSSSSPPQHGNEILPLSRPPSPLERPPALFGLPLKYVS